MSTSILREDQDKKPNQYIDCVLVCVIIQLQDLWFRKDNMPP